MGDILKEAIADAKAVRETALQNAKMALEEAFTPQLKSMLSAKLKEEEGEEEEVAEMVDADEKEVDEAYDSEEEKMDEGEMDTPEEVVPSDDEEVSETIQLNGKTYRLAEEEDEESEMTAEEMEDEEDTLDLESVIKELEDELGKEDEVSEGAEDADNAYDEKNNPDRDGLAEGPEDADNAYDEKASKEDKNGGIKSSTLAEGDDEDEDVDLDEAFLAELEEDDDEKDEVDEQSSSSDIGKGDNKVSYASAKDEEDPGKGKLSEISAELHEYKKAVSYLKGKLHEINILNAKLLFTNKLFKEFSLDNNQKLKVVETFDRTQSTREIKLVYSTLAEQFSDNGSINRKSINESASAKVGSTKPSKESKKVISEEAQVANRFKKLAGIIK